MVVETRSSRQVSLILCAAVMGLVLAMAARGEAAKYTFTKIADTSGSYNSFGYASINNKGAVAFSAISTVKGIYVSDGITLVPIADSSGPPFAFTSFSGLPSINDEGMVAFKAILGTGDSAILSGDGASTPTLLADTSTSPNWQFSFVGVPSINNGGTVAFYAVVNSTLRGIFKSDGTTETIVADANTDGPNGKFGDFQQEPSINDGNIVAYRAADALGVGIFTDERSTPTTVAHTSGLPFSGLDSPSLNNKGAVAFWATLDAGGNGIFTGPDPAEDKVIAVGDSLFGSEVTELVFGREGLNSAGQVAFVATLADKTQGVYRADPEPADDPVPPSDPPPVPEPTPEPDPAPSTVQVDIDIRPRHNPNRINLRFWGVVPVAIVSTDTFDATTIDPMTITLANAPVKLWRNGTPMVFRKDVDGDGRVDLVVLVKARAMDLDKSDTEAVLEGKMFNGTDIRGSDSIRIVRHRSRHGWRWYSIFERHHHRHHHRDARRH